MKKTYDLIIPIGSKCKCSFNLRRLHLQYGITAGGITVNTSLREVSRDGRPIELTLKEYELLLYLLKNRARVVSREELLTKVWGIDFVGETRTLDMHIGTLRKKLSDDAENAHLIKTVRGVGYRFIGE